MTQFEGIPMSNDDESFSDDSYDSDEESYSDDEEEPAAGGNLFQAFLAQMPPAEPVDTRSPAEKWKDYLATPMKHLKLTLSFMQEHGIATDEQLEPLWTKLDNTTTHLIVEQVSGMALVQRLVQSVNPQTLTYLKLDRDDWNLESSTAVLKAMAYLPQLAQVELRGMHLDDDALGYLCTSLASTNKTLKQVNLLNVALTAVTSLDPLLQVLAQTPVDELRMESTSVSDIPLLSASALHALLIVQPKWWRLALHGLGLNETHAAVLTKVLSTHAIRSFGDVLSLVHNPLLPTTELYQACAATARMGRVTLDNVAQSTALDTYRTLNNVHQRLDYMENGVYTDRARWLDWLERVRDNATHIMIALQDKPDFVRECK